MKPFEPRYVGITRSVRWRVHYVGRIICWFTVFGKSFSVRRKKEAIREAAVSKSTWKRERQRNTLWTNGTYVFVRLRYVYNSPRDSYSIKCTRTMYAWDVMVIWTTAARVFPFHLFTRKSSYKWLIYIRTCWALSVARYTNKLSRCVVVRIHGIDIHF